MPIATTNPATGELVKRFDSLDAKGIERALEHAWRASISWRLAPIDERTRLLARAADALENEKHRYAQLMTLEMGKPIMQSIAEIEKCAWVCRYYAETAPALLADEPVETDAARSFVRYQPFGVVLAIMPWNFPFWQVFRFAAPALAAGNAGVLKHASNVPQCALAIEEVFQRAGIPGGTFTTLLVESAAVEPIIADARIAAVTLTGSDAAGRSVAERAGRSLKKTVLELGGSDPFIVLPSADLDVAARTAVQARTINTGQSCIAAKRFIAHQAIAEEFERRFVERARQLVVGDPMDERTEIGPLATEQVLDTTLRQVRALVAAGAKVLVGGERLNRPGFFFAPTVITAVAHDSAAAAEEIFAPVALLYRARDLDDALAIANATPYGLGASVWTQDPVERDRAIDGLEDGSVFVNGMVKSDPRLPFGGIKRSGYGRELGRLGILEFVNAKTVWLK